jgi:hypothetical protein
MKDKCTLLMTACIEPSKDNLKRNSIHRSDALIRISDYETAFKYWLENPGSNISAIVFVENSGYSLESLKTIAQIHNKHNLKIEFLQKLAGELPAGLHYGYSELEMVDYAFENSALIKESEYVVKVTGRLYFPKLSRLLKWIPQNADIAIDTKDFKIGSKEKHYVVTTVFVTKKAFYLKQLLNAKQLMAPEKRKTHIETIYYSVLKPLYEANNKDIILRFPFNLDPVGVGAHWNKNYQSTKHTLESIARNLSRKLLPKLWI